ncbi:MAG: CRISPR-associated endonuclease Cas2 [Actinobacteria bacterium]|nr:CRISPR-associated endonuclease Cas2 [Actinomycetota bacterium]MBI3689018.1 CRISPR-associated endonuclease Cas2 [Actinomycetota bacterium]
MRTVVAYDISDDGRRARFAAVLAAMGERIQKSVFTCELDDDQLSFVVGHANELVDLGNDRVHLLTQCPDCAAAIRTVGQATIPRAVEYWIL